MKRRSLTQALSTGEGGRRTLFLFLCLFLTISFNVKAQEDEIYSDEDTASVITSPAYKENPAKYLRNIDSISIPTGILIDRVKFKNDMALFNGKSKVKTCDYAIFRRVLKNLKEAANSKVYFPNIDTAWNFAYQNMRWRHTYPIAMLNYSFNKVQEKALNNKLAVENDSMLIVYGQPDSIFTTVRSFLASPFSIRMHGDNIPVVFNKNMYFTNDTINSITKIEANFGSGWQTFKWDEPQTISFKGKTEYIEAKVRITLQSKTDSKQHKLVSHFTVLRSGSDLVPEPSVLSTGSLKSAPTGVSGDYFYPTGNTTDPIEYNIYFNSTNTKLRKPIIICDGFDPGDFTRWDQTFLPDPKEDDNWLRDDRGLYQILNGDASPFYKDAQLTGYYDANPVDMISTLRSLGYDFVFVNFQDGAGDIAKNAYWYRKFLKDVVNGSYRDNLTEENVVIGPSMGGLISRIALDSAETVYHEEHYVREYISFDVPHTGAYIPVSLQYSVFYLYNRVLDHPKDQADNKRMLEEKLGIMNTPAARQMLIRHYSTLGSDEYTSRNNYSSENDKIIQPCPEFTPFYDNLNTMGYPRISRNIAISNGGNGTLYPDNIGKTTSFESKRTIRVPNCELGPAGCLIWTDVNFYTNSNGMITKSGRYTLFNGDCDDADAGTINNDYTLYASDIGCFDNAPGGWYYGNHSINAHDANNAKPDKYQIQNRWATFMVSASAFGLPVTAENIHKTWTQLQTDYKSQIPFDNVYGMPGINEQHVRVSSTTATKLKDYLEKDDIDNILRPRYNFRSGLNETVSGALRLNAYKTLTIGGSSDGKSTYTINSGADVNMNAATSVKFLPGAKALKGAKLKVKVGATATQKSAIVTSTLPSPMYPLASPYIGRLAGYADNDAANPVYINKVEPNKEIKMYPNPVSNSLTIELPNAGNANVTITNSMGLTVFTHTYNTTGTIEANLSVLPYGMYYIKVTNGSNSFSSKLIKTRQ